jgi:glyoxalase family protein
MSTQIPGLHHVTAIAGDPQRNVDFYTRVLGLRLVKLTVNFDSPDTYHLYFGDEKGTPGTIITFFPWPSAPRGRRGAGMVDTVSFAVPEESLRFWLVRLADHGVDFQGPQQRFDEEVARFSDPDGLSLELVAVRGLGADDSGGAGLIPHEHAIRGFFGVTLLESQWEETESFLRTAMGFQTAASEGRRVRFTSGGDALGTFVEVLRAPSQAPGDVAVGTVHHIAWRTPDVATQGVWRKSLLDKGFSVTPTIDRKYFSSIYFREPGGVLFEIATDPPGFAVDEDEAKLGRRLMLPPWFEDRRANITASLPPLVLPDVERAA